MKNTKIKIALVYPNKYRAGISSYAIQLLHSLFNSELEIKCERFFLPDHIKLPFRVVELQQHTIKADLLRSADSNTPIRDFDVIAVTLQYEIDYLNVLWLLDAANIPFRSQDRSSEIHAGKSKGFPILIAGGPCAHSNPLSMLNIFDLTCIGDFEPALHSLTQFLLKNVEKLGTFSFLINSILTQKNPLDNLKDAWIEPLLQIDNIIINAMVSSNLKLPKAKKKYMNNWSQSKTPINQISAQFEQPNEDSAFGNTFLIEINRGCPYGCRFCMTGFLNRPFRNRPLSDIISSIDHVVITKESDKITLIGSSVADHPNFSDICEYIAKYNLRVMIPSIRLNKITSELLQILRKGGLNSLTVAPESGSDQLRNSVNKRISNEEIVEKSKMIFEHGFTSIKYYFLFGLPFETDEDIQALCDLMIKISKLAPKTRSKNTLTVSINPFIPKLFTPYGSFTFHYIDKKMVQLKNIEGKIRNILGKVPNISLEFMNLKEARTQTIFSQIDETFTDFLIDFYYAGGQPVEIDKWDKTHDNKITNLLTESYDIFFNTVESENPDFKYNSTSEKIRNIIDLGMYPNYLNMELNRAKKNQITNPCNEICTMCGICNEHRNSKSKHL